MKKFIQTIFILLGVIFFILIVAGIYLYVADPFKIKPIINNLTEQSVPTKKEIIPSKQTDTTNNAAVNKSLILTPSQIQTLQKIGVNPNIIPTSISPAMEQCFYDKLGVNRADEIKGGAQPTAVDVFKIRSCIK